jgi:hypothetical protein
MPSGRSWKKFLSTQAANLQRAAQKRFEIKPETEDTPSTRSSAFGHAAACHRDSG